MKYLFRHTFIVFLLISLASCDVASSLLTTNHFEQFKDYNPFSLVIDVESWELEQDKEGKIIEYTAAALSDDNSYDFFDQMAENIDYRNAVTNYYRTVTLITVPVVDSETYLADLAKYQRNAMALGRIEMYTRSGNAVNGFNSLYGSYFSGDEELLTQTKFVSEVFKIPVDGSYNYDADQIKAELKDDLIGAYNAGRAFDSLGITILDTDNPTAEVVTADDAIIILLGSMINRIVELTMLVHTGKTSDTVLTELRDHIFENDFDPTELIFPQDTTVAGGDTMLEHYLGEGGALIYTATGYELPSVTVLGGSAQ